MALVSVLLPAYNASAFIEETINSIFAQTVSDWELIIINDASTDNTLDIINQFNDQRIIIINNLQNLGMGQTLNIGLKHASGKYIARIDSDDISLPARLKIQLDFLEANADYIIVGSTAIQIDADGKETGQIMHLFESDAAIKAALFFTCPMIHPSIMIRNGYDRNKAIQYPSAAKYSEDYMLYSELFLSGCFTNIKEPLIKYRIHESANRVTDDRNSAQIIKGRMFAWRNILRALGLDASDEILIVHDKITYYRNRISVDNHEFFIPYLNLLVEMLIANNQIKIFDAHLFAKQISARAYSTLIHPALSFRDSMNWFFHNRGVLSHTEQIKFPVNKLLRVLRLKK